MVISRLVSLCNLVSLKHQLVSTSFLQLPCDLPQSSCSVVRILRLLSFSKIANEVINILGLLPRRWACVLLEWLLRIGAAES